MRSRDYAGVESPLITVEAHLSGDLLISLATAKLPKEAGGLDLPFALA